MEQRSVQRSDSDAQAYQNTKEGLKQTEILIQVNNEKKQQQTNPNFK